MLAFIGFFFLATSCPKQESAEVLGLVGVQLIYTVFKCIVVP